MVTQRSLLLIKFRFRKYSADDPCCFPKKMLSVFQKMNSKRQESNTEQQIIMMQETDYKSWHKLSSSDPGNVCPYL